MWKKGAKKILMERRGLKGKRENKALPLKYQIWMSGMEVTMDLIQMKKKKRKKMILIQTVARRAREARTLRRKRRRKILMLMKHLRTVMTGMMREERLIT